jgi:hypothetical protein
MHFTTVTQFSQLVAVLSIIIVSSLIATLEFETVLIRLVIEEQSQHSLLVGTEYFVGAFNKS